MKDKQVNFRVPEEMYFKVKERAEQLDLTVSSYLSYLVGQDLGFADEGVKANDRDVLLDLLKSVRAVEGRLTELEKRL